MVPFHVVRLAGDALGRYRRRIQHGLHGHRSRASEPLCRARRTLHTGHDLLTDRQCQRSTALSGLDEHAQVEATWGINQRLVRAYRDPDRACGRVLMTALIKPVSADVPASRLHPGVPDVVVQNT